MNGLRGGGYRMTVTRQSIINVLNNTKEHLSAEDIYMKVHAVYPAIGLTSVYRTLEMLVEIAMVSKFDFGEGRARYELAGDNQEKDHHHHLVCTECKKVINYKDFLDEEVKLIKKIEKSLSKKHDFNIKTHLLQFYGLCDKCRK
jgi:Fur family ferric uptake transcriptional regulator